LYGGGNFLQRHDYIDFAKKNLDIAFAKRYRVLMRELGQEQRGMQQKRERAFWLDVLRVLLCVGVVVCHYFGSPLIGAASTGGFFVLSGFLLAGGFERMRQKGGMNVCTFYQSKLIRLMPTLLAGLLLGFLCVLARHFIPSVYVPLYRSWQGSDFRLAEFLRYYNLPLWFMVCELAFIALAPFLYYVYYRGKAWLYALLAAAFAFTASLYFKDGLASPFAEELYHEPQVRLWQFIAGLCAWRMFANVQLVSYKKVAAYMLFALMAIILVAATTVKQEHYWCRAFVFDTGMVLLFIASIPATAKLPAPRSSRLGATFAYLAALTYPVYLYHFPVWQFVRGVLVILLHYQLPIVVLISIATCATLVLSALSLRYLDGFFARRKN